MSAAATLPELEGLEAGLQALIERQRLIARCRRRPNPLAAL